jgi:putative hemolysin
VSDPSLYALLGALLLASAFFSSSETALFSLSPSERRRAGPAVARLLEDPRGLLVTILLANLVINLLFFAFAARLGAGGTTGEELAAGALALFAIVLLGEVLPKSLALRARTRIARLGAAPLTVLVPLVGPLRRAADGVLELVYRALGDAGRSERGITAEELGRALEHSARQGLLLDSEADLLAGLAELEDIRVREIMLPRVDAVFLDLEDDDHAEAVERAVARKDAWVIVIEGDADHVVGRVRLRTLLTQPEVDPRGLLEPVLFVPEVASAMALLKLLQERHLAQAVVVDEWGGTAGLVSIEDVFEEIVGELRIEGEVEEELVRPVDGGRFLVSGNLPIRDWNELFGHRVVPNEFETVGGFVVALFGRIPRVGDRVSAGGLDFEVRALVRRRVTSLAIIVAARAPAAALAPGRGAAEEPASVGPGGAGPGGGAPGPSAADTEDRP